MCSMKSYFVAFSGGLAIQLHFTPPPPESRATAQIPGDSDTQFIVKVFDRVWVKWWILVVAPQQQQVGVTVMRDERAKAADR